MRNLKSLILGFVPLLSSYSQAMVTALDGSVNDGCSLPFSPDPFSSKIPIALYFDLDRTWRSVIFLKTIFVFLLH